MKKKDKRDCKKYFNFIFRTMLKWHYVEIQIYPGNKINKVKQSRNIKIYRGFSLRMLSVK